MSSDPERNTACPDTELPSAHGETPTDQNINPEDVAAPVKPQKAQRKVCFPPQDNQLVTEYFEPAHPWQDVPPTTREQLIAEYLDSCRRHQTPPIPSVLEQIQELPESAIGGAARAPRLTLSECVLAGAAPADALEAVLRKAQFRRLDVDNVTIDDEGAEALFDMIEYYESATILSIGGRRDFGVRGWQAASRMIKKSAELSELEVHSQSMEPSHVAVMVRALCPHTCRLRSLTLQQVALYGEPLLCLVMVLKLNRSLRELRLGENAFRTADAAQLAALLRANRRLKLLDLSNNYIQDAGAAHIADALVDQADMSPPSSASSPQSPHHCPPGVMPVSRQNRRGLAYLVLWNNQLTRNCVSHLARALRNSTSLCVLNVGRNSLGSAALRSLHGPALVSLGLQAAHLGADAAAPLADLIRHSPRLQRLDLRDNKLDCEGLQAIHQAMKENNTLIQIDLDDTTEPTTSLTADASTAATCARLTREIRALCQRNEPHATSAHRVHRKISLTCRSACAELTVQEEERRGGRLRSPAPSPAPSPAGSPIPGAQPHSRFSVTRVTPERESSTSSNESSSPSGCGPAASRFRVMQVSEPPQIHVQPAEPQRSASRFSVTRNYDTIYNPTATTPPPSATTTPVDIPTAKPPIEPTIDTFTAKDSVLLAKEKLDAHAPIVQVLKTKDDDTITTQQSVKLEHTLQCHVQAATNETKHEEQTAQPAVQNDGEQIHADKRELHTALDVIKTAVVVQEAKSNLQEATEVPSTAQAAEISTACVRKDKCDTMQEQSIQVHITEEAQCSDSTVGCSIKHMDTADLVENIAEDIHGSTGCEEVDCVKVAVEVGKDLPGDAPDKSGSLISGSVVKQDGDIEKGVAKTVATDTAGKCRGIFANEIDNTEAQCKSTVADVKIDSNCDAAVKDEDKNDKINDDSVKYSAYKDKIEQIYHDESISNVDNEEDSKSITNTTEATKTNILDVKVDVSVKLLKGDAKCENLSDSFKSSVITTVYSHPAKVHTNQNETSESADSLNDEALKQIEAITQDLNLLIKDMQSISTKATLTRAPGDVSTIIHDYSQTQTTEVMELDTLDSILRKSVILKKNKSESSLDSPDLEVSRLMNKIPVSYCDSSSSYSGSSMESLAADKVRPIVVEQVVYSSLGRRKPEFAALSTESSLESSDATPINLLNTSTSSHDSVSPVFGVKKKIHGSLSSLEASVSSLDSARGAEKVMVTSADSGIEYSLQQPSESKEDTSSNEGTLTNTSSLRDAAPLTERADFLHSVQDTLTSSPKRTSSLLDVPALKGKTVDRSRKISFVAPSVSFHVPKQDAELPKQESKLPTNLEKLLSLFHNPGSLFSRSNSQSEEERKCASSTPPRREPAGLASTFWSWGTADRPPDRDDDEKDSSSETTDSTLSERVQVSYVDESFTRKATSKTPSSDTEPTHSEAHSSSDRHDNTIQTTDDNIVQTVDLSIKAVASPNGNEPSDETDLNKPNDMNKNLCDSSASETNEELARSTENKPTASVGDAKAVDRPRSFAAVLKCSANENTERQASPDNGHSVGKLPSKVIRGIKENISPENTLTSSMTNTKTLALELDQRQLTYQPVVGAVWELATDIGDANIQDAKLQNRPDFDVTSVGVKAGIPLSDLLQENLVMLRDSGVVTAVEPTLGKAAEPHDAAAPDCRQNVDLGKDALSYLIYENQDFEPEAEPPLVETKPEELPVLSEELRDADIKEQTNLDLSPELVIDLPTNAVLPEVFTPKDLHRSSPIAPERAKIKSNSMEDLSQRLQSAVCMETTPKVKSRNIAFNVPEGSSTTPRDIPERCTKLRSRSGSSPKSLPESLNKPASIPKLDSICKKKKKVSSLGKMARDSLLALNKTEDEIADIRREYKLTSVESLRSLESVSEDANSQSGNSADSRCRCLRASQESLMSLDSITEDCRCDSACDRGEAGHSAR